MLPLSALPARARPHARPTAAPRRLLPLLLLALAATAAHAQTTTTYAYTGGAQTYTVPAGITAVQVVATGGSGGLSGITTNYSYGARAQATLTVTPGEVLTVQVGGQGGSGNSGTIAGGYNGGGNGSGGGAGGGASDVRRASAAGGTGDYLTSRNALVVAGGGGGSEDYAPVMGGNGGTPTGGNGTPSSSAYAGREGGGASQTAPGSAGSGGSGANAGSNGTGGGGGYRGSGGGGGYYGGGGSDGYDAGGGGGSSWVMPTGSTGILYSVAAAVGNGAVSITPVAATFAYTGATQTYLVPSGVTAVQVVATGASGGIYSTNTNYSYGARAQATLTVTPGETLTIQVGGRGSNGNTISGITAGGYNGGGAGKKNGAGGGASDVRRASSVGSTGDYLTSRNALLVAGGGGGSDIAPGTGGSGGTPTGGNGTPSSSTYAGGKGGGASQTAPGSAGSFAGGTGSPGSSGTGGASDAIYDGCGGGGGYYGGGGSSASAGGGGGSSWATATATGVSYSVAAATGAGSVSILPLTTSYAYTGGLQTYTVPAGVTAVRVVATGGSGGIVSSPNIPAQGASVQATVLVTPGEVLTLAVGGQGTNGNGATVAGGYNGGGNGSTSGGGGGATDVRRAYTASTATGDYLTTRNALVVAGGGGGGDVNTSFRGGNGGTPTGGNGQGFGSPGLGATQAGPGGGGVPGSGPNGGSGSSSYNAGGGGGYYGGGAGSGSVNGGGGGSSWVRPTGSTGISYSVAPATGDGAVSITPVPLDDLVVSSAGQSIGAGLYNSLTVLSGGVGTLTANTYVAGSTTVQSGGVLNDGCQVLSGPGSFTLAAGGTLGICAPQGISSSGSTGAVQVTGTRSFSPDALYTYNGSAAQATGPGLPATVRTLTLANAAGLTLTGPLTATTAATLTTGVLSTGANALTLGSAAALSETTTGYATGTVQTTRDLSTAGTTEAFGGLGLTLTPSGATLPGSTLVRRVTGTALTGAGSSRSARRYFDIQTTVASGLNVDLALTVRDDERNGIAPSPLRLFKSEDAGSSWQLQAAATFSSIAASGSQPATYTASLAGVPSFSLWTLGDARNPLPVELVAFTATAAGPAAAQLAWTTASEVNSARFEVERSADGVAYYKVGEAAAAGSSATTRHYGYLDAAAPAGTSYYRLRQVDQDGTAAYSPVRTVTLGGAGGLALYPNPAPGGAATLTGAQPGAVVTVLDALGRPVATATADASGTARLAGLAPGLYLVRAGAATTRLAVE